jgi:hypothetical protein
MPLYSFSLHVCYIPDNLTVFHSNMKSTNSLASRYSLFSGLLFSKGNLPCRFPQYLFSDTLNPRISLRDQASHPQKAAGRIAFLYNSICTILEGQEVNIYWNEWQQGFRGWISLIFFLNVFLICYCRPQIRMLFHCYILRSAGEGFTCE